MRARCPGHSHQQLRVRGMRSGTAVCPHRFPPFPIRAVRRVVRRVVRRPVTGRMIWRRCVLRRQTGCVARWVRSRTMSMTTKRWTPSQPRATPPVPRHHHPQRSRVTIGIISTLSVLRRIGRAERPKWSHGAAAASFMSGFRHERSRDCAPRAWATPPFVVTISRQPHSRKELHLHRSEDLVASASRKPPANRHETGRASA